MSQVVSAQDSNNPTNQHTGTDDQASRLRDLVNSLESTVPQETQQVDPNDRRFTPPARRIPVISIASGKGGVGKTNTSVNLAIALARHNRRAILLDADIGLANADVRCGLMPKARLESAVDENFSLEDLAIDAPGGFRLIPGSVGIGRVGELDEAERSVLLSRLNDLHASNDVIMIDTSAGLGPSVTAFIDASDACLIVATPEPTSIADAYALIKVLVTRQHEDPNAKVPTLALIVNQAMNEKEANTVHARISGVCDRFLGYPLPMIGYVRKDKKVVKAIKARSPYMVEAPKSNASRDMAELAASMIDWLGIEGRAQAAPRRRFFGR